MDQSSDTMPVIRIQSHNKMKQGLFQSPLTFLNLPLSTDFENADVAILGIPYDCARDMIRFGSRLGPMPFDTPLF